MSQLLLLSDIIPSQTDPATLRLWAYAGFLALVAAFLALDLGVFHRTAHEVSMKEAVGWSIVWLTCGLGFAVAVYFAYEHHWLGLGLSTPKYNPAYIAGDPSSSLIIRGEVGGAEAARQYLVGYVVEKSLAMDNIFVIALIFSFFAVPAKYQHRVLFWGILGALVMRGGMIFIGAELILKYQWILIFFGGFLVLTALKMAFIKSSNDVSQNIAVKLARKLFRVTDFYDGQRFFTRRTTAPGEAQTGASGMSGSWAITPLFLALVLVEITDLVFAVDSIPAVFAISPDPFIVFTSNIFAILGLRALYFCLASLIARFRFLKPALILILAFVGVKLLLMAVPPYLPLVGLAARSPIKVDSTVSLCVVVVTLIAGAALSVVFPAPNAKSSQH